LNISLDIIGPGDKIYIDNLKQEIVGYENIRILPGVSQKDIDELLPQYDIGFAFYSNTNLNNYYCAPNKIFQYINNRVAIISNDYPGLISLVQNNKIGVCVNKINEEQLESAIRKIQKEQLYNNITDELRFNYSWNTQEDNFLSLFNKN
jgi:glycosyltransferase involved in cell wall biosynthesis